VDNISAEIALIAAIVEQARKDKTSLTVQPPRTCSVEFSHNCRRCARDFLTQLDDAVREYPGMRIYELAETVMEIIG
jgi:hypothetical protein